jgi:hypothetical protein
MLSFERWKKMSVENICTYSFIELDAKILKVRTYVSKLFCKSYAIQLKPCISLEPFYFSPVG